MGAGVLLEEPLEHGLKRLVRRHLGRAALDLEDPALAPEARVASARRRLKKARAVLALIRPALGPSWQAEKSALTRLNRRLSELSDQRALYATLEGLEPALARAAGEEACRRARTAAAGAVGALPFALAPLAAELRALRLRARGWLLPGEIAAPVVAGAFARSLQKARDAHARAVVAPDHTHGWRKRLVRVRYQLEALRQHLEAPEPTLAALRALSALLGRDRDLELLRRFLLSRAALLGPGETRRMAAVIEGAREALRPTILTHAHAVAPALDRRRAELEAQLRRHRGALPAA